MLEPSTRTYETAVGRWTLGGDGLATAQIRSSWQGLGGQLLDQRPGQVLIKKVNLSADRFCTVLEPPTRPKPHTANKVATALQEHSYRVGCSTTRREFMARSELKANVGTMMG